MQRLQGDDQAVAPERRDEPGDAGGRDPSMRKRGLQHGQISQRALDDRAADRARQTTMRALRAPIRAAPRPLPSAEIGGIAEGTRGQRDQQLPCRARAPA